MTRNRAAIVPTQELAELAHHTEAVLPASYQPRELHMSAAQVPGADVFITSRSVVNLAGPEEPNVTPHTHPVSQTYLFVSADRSLEVDVEIDGEHFLTKAPSSAFIPAGTLHALRILRGTGSVISIVRSGEYL